MSEPMTAADGWPLMPERMSPAEAPLTDEQWLGTATCTGEDGAVHPEHDFYVAREGGTLTCRRCALHEAMAVYRRTVRLLNRIIADRQAQLSVLVVSRQIRLLDKEEASELDRLRASVADAIQRREALLDHLCASLRNEA